MRKLSNNNLLSILFAVLLALSMGILAGCGDQGPAEEAGETIDEAMEETAEGMEDAVESMEDAAEEAEDELDNLTDNDE